MNNIKLLPMALFCALFTKILICGSSWTDAGVLLILGIYSAFYEFSLQNKSTKIIHARLDEFDKHLTALYKGQEDVKTKVSAAAMAQNFRPANLR